jgi:hypothetical protein
VDFHTIVGYLSGLYFIKADMDASTLLRTASLVHTLDAILCGLIAGQSGRNKKGWSAAGLVLGIWALAALFLLADKRRGGK